MIDPIEGESQDYPIERRRVRVYRGRGFWECLFRGDVSHTVITTLDSYLITPTLDATLIMVVMVDLSDLSLEVFMDSDSFLTLLH